MKPPASRSSSLPLAHYERLSIENTVVIVDTGRPLSVDLSRSAMPAAFRSKCPPARRRFVINSGAPKFAGERFRQMARMTAAHSTVTVNDTSSSRFSQSRFLGPIITSGVSRVVVEAQGRTGPPESVMANHDGYLSSLRAPARARHRRAERRPGTIRAAATGLRADGQRS